MLNDAKQKKFSAILIHKFDRAFRNVKDALNTLDELKEIGVDFVSITEQVDTTSAMGKFFFVIISGFAELERGLTSERLNLTLDSKFEQGIMVGKTPFGYSWNKRKKMIVVNEKEASIVRDIFKLTSEGLGYREICKKYKLKPQSYYNIIRNKVYIGIIEFRGKTKKGNHEKIIKEELFYKVNEKDN